MSQNHSPSTTLLVKAPQGGTKEIDVSHTPFTIGRKSDNDLCLEDVAVSGHHARISQVQKVLFLEDLRSTNGTFVNEQKIDRRQLQDTDSIRVGAHRLTFQAHQPTPVVAPQASESFVTDNTILVSDSRDGVREASEQKVGLIEILSGKTSQPQYRLTKHVSLIGAQDDAVITLTGWFAPKTAAVITRRGDLYVVNSTESGKRIFINGRPVQGELALRHADVVEVAGITMRFLVQDLRKTPRVSFAKG